MRQIMVVGLVAMLLSSGCATVYRVNTTGDVVGKFKSAAECEQAVSVATEKSFCADRSEAQRQAMGWVATAGHILIGIGTVAGAIAGFVK